MAAYSTMILVTTSLIFVVEQNNLICKPFETGWKCLVDLQYFELGLGQRIESLTLNQDAVFPIQNKKVSLLLRTVKLTVYLQRQYMKTPQLINKRITNQ